jgi:hypothetical protein
MSKKRANENLASICMRSVLAIRLSYKSRREKYTLIGHIAHSANSSLYAFDLSARLENKVVISATAFSRQKNANGGSTKKRK